MSDPLGDTVFEEREELMVSPTGGTPTLRVAHFLKPTIASISGPNLKPPSISLSSETKWPSKVSFEGWRDPQRKWKAWVDRMHSLHQSVWKEAGIYDAVMASTYTIRRNNDVIFGVAERWFTETNSFIFPWGETTITLEDMMILGGYSVLGAPVSVPLETTKMVEIEETLNKEWKKLVQSKAQKAAHSEWIKRFMESGSEFEHEAFLSLWLSRYVFPGNVHDSICKHLFPIGIRLARGTRIALAPSVLASIYRDMGLLKKAISMVSSHNSLAQLTLSAPLRLVQIWVWERFPPLRPHPKTIDYGKQRLARWHDLKKFNIKNVSSAIDSAGKSFQWCPYTMAVDNRSLPNFFKERGESVSIGLDLDEEIESFARCLRVCDLVGIDCIEQYLPHRVAMQFGIDQDLPGSVTRSNASPEVAWRYYNRPIGDAKLVIPYTLFHSGVTAQYLKWWKKSVFANLETNIMEATDDPLLPVESEGLQSSNGAFKKAESLAKPVETIVQSEVAKGITETVRGDGIDSGDGSLVDNAVNINGNGGEGSGYMSFEASAFELEARISKLEGVVAGLKAARLGKRGVKKN